VDRGRSVRRNQLRHAYDKHWRLGVKFPATSPKAWLKGGATEAIYSATGGNIAISSGHANDVIIMSNTVGGVGTLALNATANIVLDQASTTLAVTKTAIDLSEAGAKLTTVGAQVITLTKGTALRTEASRLILVGTVATPTKALGLHCSQRHRQRVYRFSRHQCRRSGTNIGILTGNYETGSTYSDSKRLFSIF
jgi:hypothetical protein